VHKLLQLICAFRSWNWESSLTTLERIMKYFIARQLRLANAAHMNNDPVHEVVHRSDARAKEKSIEAPRRYGRVKSKRSRPRPPPHHVTASRPHGKKVKAFLQYPRLLSGISALLGFCCKNVKKKNIMNLRQLIELPYDGTPIYSRVSLEECGAASSCARRRKRRDPVPRRQSPKVV